MNLIRVSWALICSALVSIVYFPTTTESLGFACDQAIADGVSWDLSSLGGPRSVMHTVDEIVSLKNTTYTIDICQGLILKERKSGDKLCPFGSRVCAMERIVNDNTSILERGWPIAGELKEHAGGHLDERWERLKTSSSSPNSNIEGVKLEMNGGFLIRDDGKKRSQKAVVEFICDQTRTGTENLLIPEDEYLQPKSKRVSTTESFSDVTINSEDGINKPVPSLIFVEYDQDGKDVDVLYLSWRTKFACEDAKDHNKSESHQWGFFSWLILVDGARGWDLLPHSDMIQDIPYLFKDWIRRVFITVQGGRSRRGYAAV